MAAENLFSNLDVADLDQTAKQFGFRKKGPRTWWRRTSDFVQVVNLQRSQWSREVVYLNFALWCLALGEPPTLAEHKLHFRTRGEFLGGSDLAGFFDEVDKLTTLPDLAAALRTKRISGLVSRHMRHLLP